MKVIAPLFAALLLPVLAFSQVPAHWYDHAVIYEIYPRSFQDSNGDGIGDLNGITARLDYLKELGVDAIWITPFFPSPNFDFGYDVSDYTNVSPEYGTMQDWDHLVAEARKRDIRILIDFVVNHTSDQHPWFKESRSSRDNPKRDWYIWRSGGGKDKPPTHWTSIFGGYTWTWDEPTEQWYYHIFLPQQPDVNWTNPDLRKAMFDVVRFWLDHGASGLRLDATPYLIEDMTFPEDYSPPEPGGPAALKPYNSGRAENHDVLKEMRRILDTYPGDPVLLGESATATIEDLAKVYGKNRDEIQLPMNFLIGDMKKLDASAFKKQVDSAELQLGGQTPVFFFSSHDHSRQWTVFGDGVHNDQIAKVTSAFILAERGTALMYYGEELGMGTMPASELKNFPTGPKRPRADMRDGARTPMQWNATTNAGFSKGDPWLPVETTFKRYNVAAEKKDPHSVYSWYVQLLKLRRENAALRDGSYVPLETGNPNVFAFARKAGNESVMVVVNTSATSQTVHVSGMPGTWPSFQKMLMASPAAVAPRTSALKMAPYGVMIVE